MRKLDSQLRVYRAQLLAEVGLSEAEVDKVATIIASEVRFLSVEEKEMVRASSPVDINARWDELVAFQRFNDFAESQKSVPEIVRTRVLAQNYICFVYLKDACFETLMQFAKSGSTSYLCCKYLSSGKLRKFRNGFSHANWRYNQNFSGLVFWVRKDPRNPNSALEEYEVSQAELSFWQTLSRASAIAIYDQLR
jgi:hypothetical protein